MKHEMKQTEDRTRMGFHTLKPTKTSMEAMVNERSGVKCRIGMKKVTQESGSLRNEMGAKDATWKRGWEPC